jgi:hypothetical protein
MVPVPIVFTSEGCLSDREGTVIVYGAPILSGEVALEDGPLNGGSSPVVVIDGATAVTGSVSVEDATGDSRGANDQGAKVINGAAIVVRIVLGERAVGDGKGALIVNGAAIVVALVVFERHFMDGEGGATVHIYCTTI